MIQIWRDRIVKDRQKIVKIKNICSKKLLTNKNKCSILGPISRQKEPFQNHTNGAGMRPSVGIESIINGKIDAENAKNKNFCRLL